MIRRLASHGSRSTAFALPEASTAAVSAASGNPLDRRSPRDLGARSRAHPRAPGAGRGDAPLLVARASAVAAARSCSASSAPAPDSR